MSLIIDSRCTIDHQPTGASASIQRSWKRASIELYTRSDGYVIKLIDLDAVNKDKKELLCYILTKSDKYKFGLSLDQPDEILCNKGTFFIKLDPKTRSDFHNQLRFLLDAITQDESSPQPKEEQATSKKLRYSRNFEKGQDILFDIHDLNVHIQRGNDGKAVDLIKALVKNKVRLQLTEHAKSSNISQISIRVRIEGINREIEGHGDEHSLRVNTAIKIHELRALFAYVYGFPIASQFFFVNGHLAYARSTMEELNVKNETLFVLLVTSK